MKPEDDEDDLTIEGDDDLTIEDDDIFDLSDIEDDLFGKEDWF